LTPAEENYYATMKELGEFGLIGAGIGGGFLNTSELHVMKVDEAMRLNPINQTGIKLYSKNMIALRIIQPLKQSTVTKSPKDTKIITSTWAMKKKAIGTYRARLNARGFETSRWKTLQQNPNLISCCERDNCKDGIYSNLHGKVVRNAIEC
jgi:hypothetical protein